MINKKYSDEILSICEYAGIPDQLSKLIACQGALESQNFTSHVFVTDNNAYGYKYVKGAHLQAGEGLKSTETDHYAHYSIWENSALEIVLWIKRRKKEGKFPADLNEIKTPEDYAHYLKACGYFGGKEADYANDLAYYLKTI